MALKSYLYKIEHIQMCYEQPRNKSIDRCKNNKYPCMWNKYKTQNSCQGFSIPRARKRKKIKNFRNRWIRRWNKYEVPPVKYRYGWEY